MKSVDQERRGHADVVRPELTNRTDRIRAIIEPGLKNVVPSEVGLLSDFIVADLREHHLTAGFAIIGAEQERALEGRRTK